VNSIYDIKFYINKFSIKNTYNNTFNYKKIKFVNFKNELLIRYFKNYLETFGIYIQTFVFTNE